LRHLRGSCPQLCGRGRDYAQPRDLILAYFGAGDCHCSLELGNPRIFGFGGRRQGSLHRMDLERAFVRPLVRALQHLPDRRACTICSQRCAAA
jgi:hypothetical protein